MMSEYPSVRRPLPTCPPYSRARRLPPGPVALALSPRRASMAAASFPYAPRRTAVSGPAGAERGRQLHLGTHCEGCEKTPWSRARRLALKRGARGVLAAGTLEALGVAASRSLTQAVR